MDPKILYFVHDLDDPAVARRIAMLRTGGAEVELAGFHRFPKPPPSVGGVAALSLGRTQPAKLLSRALSVAKAALDLKPVAEAAGRAGVIVARNLEMLALAVRARNRYAPGTPIAYECLDIHRLLLSRGPAGYGLRFVEDWLLRQTDLLLTSSPAFIRNYFEPRGFAGAVRLVENKVLALEGEPAPLPPERPAPSLPWRIGWFGVLRCRKSFEILSRLARDLPGTVEIVMRGRPAPSIFPDFEAEARARPGITFEGAYRNPEDLSAIYGGVHFTWAIDYYEEGQNSAWLLPNRIYEGSLWGAVPLALAGVETGRWLSARHAGVRLPDPPDEALRSFFSGLDAAGYSHLAGAVARIPRAGLVDDAAACRRLVQSLPLRGNERLKGVKQLQTKLSGSA